MTQASPIPSAEPLPGPSPVETSQAAAAPVAGLTLAQQTALAALSSGRSIRDAAKAAGVNRNTVARWLRADPGFRAAYNAWRQELIDSTRSRLLRTAELAAAAVHKQIARGDGRLALALLDRLGLASETAATAGPPDADLARDEMAVEREEHVVALQRRVQSIRFFSFFSDDQKRLDALRQHADEQARGAEEAMERGDADAFEAPPTRRDKAAPAKLLIRPDRPPRRLGSGSAALSTGRIRIRGGAGAQVSG